MEIFFVNWPKSDADHLIASTAQMRGFENNLINRGMPVEALMEKVGQKLKDWFLERPELLLNGVLILVGPGHNGGDGLVLARELFLENIDVSIWCPLPITQSLTRRHQAYSHWLGIKELHEEPNVYCKTLWIDALFGLGQTRPLPEKIANLLKGREEKQPRRLISIDVPSGICSDTGKTFSNVAATASYTLTIGLNKQGLIQDIAIPYVGELIRLDIGIPQKVLKKDKQINFFKLAGDDLFSIPWPEPSSISSKYQRGRLLVVAGSDKYKGAALLALQGALASGVGSIKALLPQKMADNIWQVSPEIVVSGILGNSIDGESEIGEAILKHKLDRLDSLLIGPGLALANEKWSDIACQLEKFPGLLVLDADALNRLAFSTESWEWINKREGPTWLTPHLQEFYRLFPNLKDLSPLDAAPKAAKMTGANVLLKGAHSLIASPSGVRWQLVSTSSCAARAGLGDVLAGFVAGVGAIGFSIGGAMNDELLALAALLHAEAAKSCKKGSKASSIALALEKLVRHIQCPECVQRNI